MVYHSKALHNWYLTDNTWPYTINAVRDGNVLWNTNKYTTAFLHSDWLYFLLLCYCILPSVFLSTCLPDFCIWYLFLFRDLEDQAKELVSRLKTMKVIQSRTILDLKQFKLTKCKCFAELICW